MALAFAISIAIHEMIAGAVPPNEAPRARKERVVQVRLTTLAARRTPPPSPTPPTARASTARPSPIASVPPRELAGASLPARHVARAAIAHRVAGTRPVLKASDSVVAAARAGTAAQNGAAGGGGGAESAGAGGSGPDAATADEPCGFVTFSDPHGSQYDPRTRGFWVDIRMSVHFPGGALQSVMLDYPWYYASEAENPWSDQNLRDPNFPTRFQPPPPAKAAAEPPLVQYVVAHSTPDGMTLLRDCPQPSPTPE